MPKARYDIEVATKMKGDLRAGMKQTAESADRAATATERMGKKVSSLKSDAIRQLAERTRGFQSALSRVRSQPILDVSKRANMLSSQFSGVVSATRRMSQNIGQISGRSLQQLTRNTRGAVGGFRDLSQSANSFKESLRTVSGKPFQNLIKDSRAAGDQFSKLSQSAYGLKESIKTVSGKPFQSLVKDSKAAGDQFSKLSRSAYGLKESIKTVSGKPLRTLVDESQNAGRAFMSLSNNAGFVGKTLRKISGSRALSGLSNSAKKAGDSFSNLYRNIFQTGNAINNLRSKPMNDLARRVSSATRNIKEFTRNVLVAGHNIEGLMIRAVQQLGRSFVDTTDQFTRAEGALTRFAGSAEGAEAIMSRLKTIMGESGWDLDDLRNTFEKLATALEGLGVSADEAIDMTRGLALMFRDLGIEGTALPRVAGNIARLFTRAVVPFEQLETLLGRGGFQQLFRALAGEVLKLLNIDIEEWAKRGVSAMTLLERKMRAGEVSGGLMLRAWRNLIIEGNKLSTVATEIGQGWDQVVQSAKILFDSFDDATGISSELSRILTDMSLILRAIAGDLDSADIEFTSFFKNIQNSVRWWITDGNIGFSKFVKPWLDALKKLNEQSQIRPPTKRSIETDPHGKGSPQDEGFRTPGTPPAFADRPPVPGIDPDLNTTINKTLLRIIDTVNKATIARRTRSVALGTNTKEREAEFTRIMATAGKTARDTLLRYFTEMTNDHRKAFEEIIKDTAGFTEKIKLQGGAVHEAEKQFERLEARMLEMKDRPRRSTEEQELYGKNFADIAAAWSKLLADHTTYLAANEELTAKIRKYRKEALDVADKYGQTVPELSKIQEDYIRAYQELDNLRAGNALAGADRKQFEEAQKKLFEQWKSGAINANLYTVELSKLRGEFPLSRLSADEYQERLKSLRETIHGNVLTTGRALEIESSRAPHLEEMIAYYKGRNEVEYRELVQMKAIIDRRKVQLKLNKDLLKQIEALIKIEHEFMKQLRALEKEARKTQKAYEQGMFGEVGSDQALQMLESRMMGISDRARQLGTEFVDLLEIMPELQKRLAKLFRVPPDKKSQPQPTVEGSQGLAAKLGSQVPGLSADQQKQATGLITQAAAQVGPTVLKEAARGEDLGKPAEILAEFTSNLVTMGPILAALKLALDSLLEMFRIGANMADQFSSGFKGIVGQFKKFLHIGGDMLVPVFNALGTAMEALVPVFDAGNAIFKAIAKPIKELLKALAAVFLVLKPVGQIIGATLKVVAKLISFALKPLIKALQWLTRAIVIVINGVIGGINRLIRAANKLLPKRFEINELDRVSLQTQSPYKDYDKEKEDAKDKIESELGNKLDRTNDILERQLRLQLEARAKAAEREADLRRAAAREVVRVREVRTLAEGREKYPNEVDLRERPQATGTDNQPVINVVNVMDPDNVPLNSGDGERTVMNILRQNAREYGRYGSRSR